MPDRGSTGLRACVAMSGVSQNLTVAPTGLGSLDGSNLACRATCSVEAAQGTCEPLPVFWRSRWVPELLLDVRSLDVSCQVVGFLHFVVGLGSACRVVLCSLS